MATAAAEARAALVSLGYKPTEVNRMIGAVAEEGMEAEEIIRKAVRGMLPKNRLGRQMLSKIRIYAGPEHKHEAQNPEVLDVKSMNNKNTREG